LRQLITLDKVHMQKGRDMGPLKRSRLPQGCLFVERAKFASGLNLQKLVGKAQYWLSAVQ
jgi:hypothetical protein